MKTNKKQYQMPKMKAVGLHQTEIICASGTPVTTGLWAKSMESYNVSSVNNSWFGM